ncbi:hypothetical protein ACI1US_00203 [Leucobacter sp. BZR 635]
MSTGSHSETALPPLPGGRASSTGRGSNLFDLIRIMAAAMVVIGHAWPLSGVKGPPTLAGITVHHLGVYIFFTLSGFLLSRSWSREPRPFPFLIRRSLRIFPALALVVVVTIGALGPVFTSKQPSNYWGSGETWGYLWNLTLFAQYDLPGVFADNPTTAVNGSLWSIGPEFTCYLALVALGLLGARASRLLRGVLTVAIAAAILCVPLTGPWRTTMIAVVFFVIGSLLAEIPRAVRLPLWPVLPGAAVLALTDGTSGLLAAWVIVSYAVVAIGSRSSRIAAPLHTLGDPSYGLYLWAFPLQQVIIAVAGPLPLAASIALVLPGAALLGYASWHLLEKRAIALGSALSARVVTKNRA